MNQKSKKKAIALEYSSNSAPRLTAKGDGAMAQAIIEEAKIQGIHIAEDPHLVALLSELELQEEIPENLYTAVAVILSWVYWLKGLSPAGYEEPA
jgi:flagellar biosynthesis protein|tara:strand:- start:15653 stop:15937 length:285 start_codon:yes stop_codon:yes gene_type:complete